MRQILLCHCPELIVLHIGKEGHVVDYLALVALLQYRRDALINLKLRKL